MKSRSIVLISVIVSMLIAVSSCNVPWDTPHAIDFPEAFQGSWIAVEGEDNAEITHNRFTIRIQGSYSDTITNSSEYGSSRFDWIEVDTSVENVVTITPKNVSGSVGRTDEFRINDDGTLQIEFGGVNPRSYGPFVKQTQAN